MLSFSKKSAVVFRIAAFIFLFVFVLSSGCMDSALSTTDGMNGIGQLSLSFTTPSDVSHIDVQVYLATDDASRTLVDELTLATGELTTVFTELKADDYTVEAQGYDFAAQQIYSGQGDVTVVADAHNNMCMLWMGQDNPSAMSNASPKIEYVDVDGNIVPEIADGGMDTGLYIIAPGPGELVTFTVGTSDADGDSLSIAWTVKDGPNPEDSDVGMVCGTGDSITWFHDVEGTYYVTISVSDGRGGVASFIFDITVMAP